MTQPPSDSERYAYIDGNKFGFYIPSLISTLTILVGLIHFSLSRPSLWWYLIYALLLGFYLFLSFTVGLFSRPFDFNAFKLASGGIQKPSIDVFLPSCGEDLNTIKNTINHAVLMADHYGPARVYVLDDAGNTDLSIWCIEHKIPYIHRKDRVLRKAGNIRNAFPITKGEWILILDADFVARHDMLSEMVRHIDDKSAIIQTPQYFRVSKGMPWIEKGAGFVQELFYRLIQVNRNHFGASICVGTCALYRRKALEPFGGTAPIDYSEDLHTGFMIMQGGWTIKYFPVNLAAGECPNTLESFFSQQYRWCMGSITLMTNKDFWLARRVSLVQKLCFITGMLYYVTTAAGILLTTIPAIIVLYFYPEMANWHSAVFSIPSLLVGTIVIALWSNLPFGLYAIEARIISYWAHLFAITDKARGNLMPWIPTGAVRGGTRYSLFKWLFSIYTVALVLLVVGGVYSNYENKEIYPMVSMTLFYRCLDLKIVKSLWMNEA